VESHDPSAPQGARSSDATPVLVFLSGPRRGHMEVLSGDLIGLGLGPARAIMPGDVAAARHATLRRRGGTYEIEAEPGRAIWVNGEQLDRLVLASGDVIEVGKGGDVVRFRIYGTGARVNKTVHEAFSDCLDCARHGSDKPVGKLAIFLTGLPVELATRTSAVFRVSISVVLIAVAAGTIGLAQRSQRLEERLSLQIDRVAGLSELLETSDVASITAAEIEALRAEVQAGVFETTERLEALESRSGAVGRVVSGAAGSTLFLQGSYGFREPGSGRPLRRVVRSDGRPAIDPAGEPAVSLEGDGPVLEIFYTGTGFVAGQGGLVLSNRHVAFPWETDQAARAMVAQGLEPVKLRFVGYLPGIVEPCDVSVVRASDEADVALLQCEGIAETIPHLPLSAASPSPGDEVIVLGYPLGIRALLARTPPEVVRAMMVGGPPDFWEIAERLSAGGLIAPLATSGIVGQVTQQAVVYDAETTSGGSGGPVLSLSGTVEAVNMAILPEFGGSNLGVPIARGRDLLRR